MKRIEIIHRSVVGLLMAGLTLSAFAESSLNLMPFPQKVVVNAGEFRLNADFSIALEGVGGQRIYLNATRMLRRLSNRTGLFFPQDFIIAETRSDTVDMIIKTTRIGRLGLGEDESYKLVVTPEKVNLSAETDLGVIRGLETLLQLLSADENGYFFPTVEIDDAPRFPWRGLMIDVSRHFMPVEVIKRNLDGMAAVKLNVFHWHLSDNQGIRVESKSLPNLQSMCSDGTFYTQEQIREIIAYADERGIRVIPEFDVPAHCTAWMVGYPFLASAPGPYKIARYWGVFDPTMNPAKESTYEFLDVFFKEMAALFPDEYLHIGGDENTGKEWSANPEIQAFMKVNGIDDNHALQKHFNLRVLEILTRYNKKMIGWDEIFQPALPKNIVIHSWRGYKALDEAARKGYMGILSNGYYIDLIQPAEYHYLIDPIPEGSTLSEEQKKFILGGEATSWGELVVPETIDSRIWPRTACIAERFWSPQSVRDVESMYRRMEIVSGQLEELELQHIKNYEYMLRRLTNGNNISALKRFVDVVEPVKIYNRHFQGIKYATFSPYTRVVDAARPESMTARRFRKLTDELIDSKKNENISEMTDMLQSWIANHAGLAKTIKTSPVLKEIDTLSQDLSTVSKVGLEAIEYLKKGKKAPEKWIAESKAALAQAKKPRGQTELAILPTIEKLIKSCEK